MKSRKEKPIDHLSKGGKGGGRYKGTAKSHKGEKSLFKGPRTAHAAQFEELI